MKPCLNPECKKPTETKSQVCLPCQLTLAPDYVRYLLEFPANDPRD